MKKGILLIGSFVVCSLSPIHSQQIVTDIKTTGQVVANNSSMGLHEEIMSLNHRNSKDMQEKTSTAMTVIQTSISLYRFSLENVDSFGADSKNMIEIARLIRLIATELINVTDEVGKNPKSTMTSYKTIANLSEETMQCAEYCYSIISNGKVQIPGINISKNNDGANFLDAKQRLDMCNHIIVNLKRIYNICIQIKVQLQYSTTWAKVLQQTFPFDHYLISSSWDISNDIINKIKNQ